MVCSSQLCAHGLVLAAVMATTINRPPVYKDEGAAGIFMLCLRPMHCAYIAPLLDLLQPPWME